MTLKSELLFFLKSSIAMIFMVGLVSSMIISILHPEALQSTDASNARILLGTHVNWIIPLSVLLVTLLLHPSKERKNLKLWLINGIKVFIYFELATIAIQLLGR